MAERNRKDEGGGGSRDKSLSSESELNDDEDAQEDETSGFWIKCFCCDGHLLLDKQIDSK